MSVKVSVIVPVYNPGEGIKKCIQSLITQTLKDIEIIFVDDCGTDNSMEYIRAAAQTDERIIISKNPHNIGAGQSRNRGIELARGKYLSFIDPDDYVFPDFLELLYRKGEETQANIIKGTLRSTEINNGKETISHPNATNLKIRKGLDSGKPLYTLFFYEHTTALYRREIVKKNNVQYGCSSNGEDLVFQLRASYGEKNIFFEDKAVYVYVERAGSNNRKTSVERLVGELKSIYEILDFLEKHNEITDESCEYLSRFIVKAFTVQKVLLKEERFMEEASDILEKFRGELMDKTLTEKLKKNNTVIGAFTDYYINLAPLPYSKVWYHGPYIEYKSEIDTWVDFLCKHPDYTGNCQPALWQVFEAAITFDDWDNEALINKKEAMKEVRRQAHRIPDRRVLTTHYISMKLFIDYGINTFGFRDSIIGSLAKRAAVLVRY